MANFMLKPCPFCGSGVSITFNSVLNEYHIYHKLVNDCPFDDLVVPGTNANAMSEACNVWNTRY